MGDNECDQCVIFCCLLPLILGAVASTVPAENPGGAVGLSFIIIVGLIVYLRNQNTQSREREEADERTRQENHRRKQRIRRFFERGKFPSKIESMRFFDTFSESEWRKIRIEHHIEYDRSNGGYYIPGARPLPHISFDSPQSSSGAQPQPQPQPQPEPAAKKTSTSEHEPKIYCRYCGAAISVKAHRCEYCNSPIS